MVLGFIGTLVALERAVALGSTWAYAAPAAAAMGGLAVVAGAPGDLGPALLTVAGLVLVTIFVAVHRFQPSLHNGMLAGGALCWVVAGGLWLAGWEVPRFVPWLVGFLVLTISGERLELSRLVGATRAARASFTGLGALLGVGLVLSLVAEPAGVRVAGVGLLGLAAWLAHNDIARRTIHNRGLTRYMAAALLTGYAWLAVGGILWLATGQMNDGPAYDAMLHAILLGFVIPMIFAHAPVIVPAVLGRPLPYHPILYLPLALLHGSLVLRLAGGDAAGNLTTWQLGGELNEAALLLFIALAAGATLRRTSTMPRRTGARPGAAVADRESA
jgi:hypothetical protein